MTVPVITPVGACANPTEEITSSKKTHIHEDVCLFIGLFHRADSALLDFDGDRVSWAGRGVSRYRERLPRQQQIAVAPARETSSFPEPSQISTWTETISDLIPYRPEHTTATLCSGLDSIS